MSEKWILSFEVKKVNGQPYNKRDELIAEHAHNIPKTVQRAAEVLRDRFDFGVVKATATSVNDSKRTFSFQTEAEAGMRDAWTQ